MKYENNSWQKVCRGVKAPPGLPANKELMRWENAIKWVFLKSLVSCIWDISQGKKIGFCPLLHRIMVVTELSPQQMKGEGALLMASPSQGFLSVSGHECPKCSVTCILSMKMGVFCLALKNSKPIAFNLLNVLCRCRFLLIECGSGKEISHTHVPLSVLTGLCLAWIVCMYVLWIMNAYILYMYYECSPNLIDSLRIEGVWDVSAQNRNCKT